MVNGFHIEFFNILTPPQFHHSWHVFSTTRKVCYPDLRCKTHVFHTGGPDGFSAYLGHG